MAVPFVVPVSSAEQLEQAVMSYVAQGYQPTVRTQTTALLIKKKELNLVWILVGALLCFIPLIIELVRYANADDQVIEVRVVSPGEAAAQSSRTIEIDGVSRQLSPDGQYWWDGSQWQLVAGGSQAGEVAP
jgi:hypothetical protein